MRWPPEEALKNEAVAGFSIRIDEQMETLEIL
jgi:hypothetical protein